MTDWQPIETAPKDKMIIGAFFGTDPTGLDRVFLCWWQDEFSAFISSCRQMRLAAGYSFEGGAKANLHSPVIEAITHWMPLPEPPKE